VEQDAGHFLYGLRRLSLPGLAVIEEPPHDAPKNTMDSFYRVRSWLTNDEVKVLKPSDLDWRPDQAKLFV
jgi:hypothetical protein